MRQRQSSVTTDTQYPVRSIGATDFAGGGGVEGRGSMTRCAVAKVGRNNKMISKGFWNIGSTECIIHPTFSELGWKHKYSFARCSMKSKLLVALVLSLGLLSVVLPLMAHHGN